MSAQVSEEYGVVYIYVCFWEVESNLVFQMFSVDCQLVFIGSWQIRRFKEVRNERSWLEDAGRELKETMKDLLESWK